MSDYTPVTVFVAKDSLSVNDPEKKVVGSELDGEFNAIAAAIETKMDFALLGVANGTASLNPQGRIPPEQVWAEHDEPAISASTITVNCDNANQFYAVLTENVTMAAPANPYDGQKIQIILKQDATGGRTVTWNAIFCFPGGSAPTMTATAAKADLYEGVYNDTLAKWLMTSSQNYTVA